MLKLVGIRQRPMDKIYEDAYPSIEDRIKTKRKVPLIQLRTVYRSY